ncbi:MAG: diguanylate cyclase, partial [Acidobacteria bacterium]|nr:diguanylate cyclase [Acidobacteriota bacterium]
MSDLDTSAVRILLVDDDEDDYVVTRELLADSRRTPFTLDWVATFDEAAAEIARDTHDVYLIDYRLGEHDGLELLRTVTANGCTKPLILLTGLADGDVDLAAMQAGAADYLVKGRIDASLLERSIRYALQQSRTLQALRESEERYALSARGANDGLWVWDLVSDEVYFSPRWKSMLGYGEDAIGSAPDEWFSRVHEDDVAILRGALEHHLQGHTPHFENEHRMRTRDGEVRWMLSRGLAVRDANGRALRLAGSQTDITERKRAEERLTFDAFHDALTQLPNRALFMDRLQRAIDAQHRRSDAVYAVLFLDLDRFKVVNDSLGHTVGDELLIAVADRLRKSMRASDTVARLGGDEFAVILPGVRDENGATLAATRLLESLIQPVTIEGEQLEMRASIGIVLFPRHGEDADTLLRHGDAAMYQAKRGGSGTAIYVPEAGSDAHDLTLTFELRRAIDEGGLVLHYQPVLECGSGEMVGVEALVRWQHPRHGLIGPDRFIAIAEQSRLIRPLGRRVLEAAVAQQELWWTQGLKLRMAVNLSMRNLQDPDLVPCVVRVLERHAVRPEWLTLEITESTLMADAARAMEVLERLRSMGVGVSIDDFGTGYSSLAYLK